MDNEVEIIIIHESALSSWIKDIGTFGVFAGLLLFNHRVLDGNLLIDLLFITVVLLWLGTHGSQGVHKFYRARDAKAWIDENCR